MSDEQPTNGNGNGNGKPEEPRRPIATRSKEPTEKNLERAEFLWRLVVCGAPPSKAIGALMQRDGLGERHSWEIWRIAKARWKTERQVERGPALAIVWHQAQDHFLRLAKKIEENPQNQGWYRLLIQQLGVLTELAKAAGPDTLDININAKVETRQETIVRVGAMLKEMNSDERRIATRVMAGLLTPPAGVGHSLPDLGTGGVDAAEPTGN